MKDVVLVDYGCGNIFSLIKAIEVCGARVHLTRDPEKIMSAKQLVLPGVGAFGHCRDRIYQYGLQEPLFEAARKGTSILGICVGMQMFLSVSCEQGMHEGLNLISGKVEKIDNKNENYKKKVPFIGWSKLEMNSSAVNTWLNQFEGQWFYFVHSYFAKPNNQKEVLSYYDYYSDKITAIVARDNIIGCQFHPEKSGPSGLNFLSHFLKM